MLLVITTLLTGLIAGLFYCWSISVTKGLALLPDREYLLAFQQLNRAILNPLFLTAFMGLAFDKCFGALSLCVQRVELLFETFFGAFSRVNSASDSLGRFGHRWPPFNLKNP